MPANDNDFDPTLNYDNTDDVSEDPLTDPDNVDTSNPPTEPDLTTGPNAADQDNGAFDPDPADQNGDDDDSDSDDSDNSDSDDSDPSGDDSDSDGSGLDAPPSNIPGQIPDTQDDDNTFVHQALLYLVRALQELSSHVAALDTNYSSLAGEMKAFLANFVGRLETVWQNGGVNESEANSLPPNTQDPLQRHRNVF